MWAQMANVSGVQQGGVLSELPDILPQVYLALAGTVRKEAE